MEAIKIEWWKRSAKEASISPEVMAYVKSLNRESLNDIGPQTFNKKARSICLKIYGISSLVICVNIILDRAIEYSISQEFSFIPGMNDARVAVLVTTVLVFQFIYRIYSVLRIYDQVAEVNNWMHFQMHWPFGGSKVKNFLLDHVFSVIFSVPQTSYVIGHRLHHQKDNDWSPDGWPKDLQSTYIFSKTCAPLNILLWIPYFMFGFRYIVAPYLTFKEGTLSNKVWLVLESALIILLHWALYRGSREFYLFVYWPGLLLSWLAVTSTLYEQHDVRADSFGIHPTNDAAEDPAVFSGNNGLHLEHSLFPNVHPYFLSKIHKTLRIPEAQILKEPYYLAGYRKISAAIRQLSKQFREE